MATLRIGDDVFEMHTDMIEVTMSTPYPDPRWRFTDTNGHEHHRAEHGYPTLRWVIDDTWIDPDDGEELSSGHYECVICGEHIKPGLTSDFARRFIPGMRHYTFNGEPITKDEADAIIRSRQP